MDITNILIISVIIGLIWWYFKSPSNFTPEVSDNIDVDVVPTEYAEDTDISISTEPEDEPEENLEFSENEYEIQQELIKRQKAAERVVLLQSKLERVKELNELKRRHDEIMAEYNEIEEYIKINELL